jgi:hypothetical protein
VRQLDMLNTWINIGPLSPFLLHEATQIAFDYLERAGEIEDPTRAYRFLASRVEALMREGVTHRLLLSNRAISAYQRERRSGLA